MQAVRIALLGDSIFDNASYTSGEPDVVSHLNAVLARGGSATLLAVDGATVSGVASQLRRVPDGTTHLVLSVGGNDALRNVDLLSLPVTSSAEALREFAKRIASFERAYRLMLADVAAMKLPVIVCTIYNGALEIDIASIARLALALFNDAIMRVAVEHRVDIIELRAICTERSDYANPIEPSGIGGLKIARAIARAVQGAGAVSRVFPG
jgi:lysophospholipase L1-like esterase